ncbi:MAG: tagatose 1,6-diphosphate aldolase [Anaerolineae bacterium]|nr:tagatose 1,6-diphosphate aldolase [Anaerolineae bacterium]
MIGKYRHLSRCSTGAGHFVILAIDHRANLLDALNRAAPQPMDGAAFSAFKTRVTAVLAPETTAVLTDPAYGVGAGIASRAISGHTGLIGPVEVTDYEKHPSQRAVQWIPGWSVAKIKLIGGDGVKLLLPYHPDAENAGEKRDGVQRIVDSCTQWDLPFFLEPIAYSLDPDKALTNAELLQITVDMAREFAAMGADVLKLQFPVDHKQSTDEGEWRAACAAVTEACGEVPWALLSAGVDFETFARQAEIACAAGASGVIVGRAVWSEAVTLQGEARDTFVATTARERIRRLAAICAEHATPWYDRIAAPPITLDWHEKYDEPC